MARAETTSAMPASASSQRVAGKVGPQRQQGPQLGALRLGLVVLPMRGVDPV